MCVYMGKSIDAFDDVWNMWMGYEGVDAYIHADVLGFRCFAFSCGEDISKWFSPVQSTRKALGELCRNLGIEEMCSIISASAWSRQLSELKRPVLLADVCLDVEAASVREQFYQGAPCFSLLYRHYDEEHFVYASSGVPFVELSEEQVRNKLSAAKGYVVMGNMPLRIQPFSATEILHRAMEWGRKTVDSNKGPGKPGLNHAERSMDRRFHMAIQYGLMNYQIQLSKVVRFCAEEMRVSDYMIERLNSVLLRIAEIYRSRLYKEIIRIEEDFWALVESIEEKYHV